MTEDIKHIDENSQEYIAEGNRMTKEINIHKKDSAACNFWKACDYYKQLQRLEQLKNKYYQQTLDDEITISDLIEEIQGLKADRTLERISKLSIENARLEQENKQAHEDFICSDTALRIANTELDELKQENERLQSEIRQKKMTIMMNNDHYLTVDENNRKYRSALEEIKKYIVDELCGYCHSKKEDYNEILENIENKIDEVLNDSEC